MHHFKSKKLHVHLHYSSSQIDSVSDTIINLLVYPAIFILQDVAAFSGSLDILKEVHPEKLSRLHERLVTPVQCVGSCPLPSFPGQQEFYHDFILHCSHHSFLQHLADSLASEILALNETSFMASDVEDKGRVVLEGKVPPPPSPPPPPPPTPTAPHVLLGLRGLPPPAVAELQPTSEVGTPSRCGYVVPTRMVVK